jgi:hypothetical protein
MEKLFWEFKQPNRERSNENNEVKEKKNIIKVEETELMIDSMHEDIDSHAKKRKRKSNYYSSSSSLE